MLVNLLVPGTAHLRPLAKALHELGVLNFFAYSHALSTTPASLGLPKDRAVNLWAKEYLTRGHLKVMGWRFSDALFPYYLGLWELGALRHWHPAPISHVLIWGGARRLLKLAKKEGAATVGLVANVHPTHFTALLNEEADRLGVKFKRSFNSSHQPMLEEIQYCDFLHAESEFTRASFVANGFPRERIHILRPGQDLSRFYPETGAVRRSDSDLFRAVCVGQISLRKGQTHLLEAWRRLGLKNAELTLIGTIDEQVADIIRRYSDEFTHVKNLPHRDVRAHLIRASVMVAPSVEDGYALVVAEALACGVPVITTTNTGAADLIRDGINGFVVAPSSPEAISEKLELIYRDPILLAELAQGARETISSIGSWRDRALEYVELYRRVAPKSFPLLATAAAIDRVIRSAG